MRRPPLPPRVAASLLATALLLAALPAAAHGLTRSTSVWRFHPAGADLRLRIPLLEIVRAHPAARGRTAADLASDPAVAAWLARELPSAARVDSPGCHPATPPRVSAVTQDQLDVSWSVTCDRPVDVRVAVDLFFDAAPSHVHLASLRAGALRHDRVLTAAARRATAAPEPRPFTGTVTAGAAHVLAGMDHLAFVLALLLLGGGAAGLATIVTGFTLGHSITLALAATGLVTPSPATVEPLVALSVAYAALECFHVWAPDRRHLIPALNLALHGGVAFTGLPLTPLLGSALFTTCHLALHRPDASTIRLRAVVATLFGLIHGLAFASAFGELLRGADLAGALFGFNLGVELAQLAVVATAAACLALIRRTLGEVAHAGVTSLAAAGVLALGVGLALTPLGGSYGSASTAAASAAAASTTSPEDTTGAWSAVSHGSSGHQRTRALGFDASSVSPGRGIATSTPACFAATSTRSTGSVQLCSARSKVPQCTGIIRRPRRSLWACTACSGPMCTSAQAAS